MEKIAVENGLISNFEGLVTLTLDRVILHTIMHHSSTSPTSQISLKPKKLFVDGRTDGRTYISTHGLTDGHLRPALRRVDLATSQHHKEMQHCQQDMSNINLWPQNATVTGMHAQVHLLTNLTVVLQGKSR